MHAAVAEIMSSDALPPLIKLAALLATGCAVHRSLSPPNPPAPPKTCIDNRTLFERAIRHVTFCSKVCGSVHIPAMPIAPPACPGRPPTPHDPACIPASAGSCVESDHTRREEVPCGGKAGGTGTLILATPVRALTQAAVFLCVHR